MNKYLEALKRIRQETCPATYMPDFDKNECCDIVEQALKRLESIDNVNPSEALECLEKLSKSMPQYDSWIKYIDTIKQALLKTQENARSEEILQKYYQEGITLDSVRALKKENAELKQKVQDPKQYLKWEDLEFDHKPKYIDVKMGDNKYLLIVGFSDGGNEMAILQTKLRRYYFVESEDNEQFFNDLKLERVEE